MAVQLHEFTKRILVTATVEEMYQAWATQDGLERWFLRQAKFTLPSGEARASKSPIGAGDQYEWLWHGYPDDTVERREVLGANGKDSVQFLFSGDSIVTVSIKAANRGAIVELRQQIPAGHDPELEYRIGCDTGWTFYMANLKSILEGGIDLRNKNQDLTEVLNA